MRTKAIKQLKNPKTGKYLIAKSYLTGENIPWYWTSSSTKTEKLKSDDTQYADFSFLSHSFITRPESSALKIPQINSDRASEICDMLREILDFNNVRFDCFLRINLNCIFPQGRILNSYPHADHAFPHNNLILYLTDSGGEIIVGDDVYDPKEDDVVMFDGTTHYIRSPKNKRRISLIATFL